MGLIAAAKKGKAVKEPQPLQEISDLSGPRRRWRFSLGARCQSAIAAAQQVGRDLIRSFLRGETLGELRGLVPRLISAGVFGVARARL